MPLNAIFTLLYRGTSETGGTFGTLFTQKKP